jgi:hypothetical protein
MTSPETLLTRELTAQLIGRAWKDPIFKQALLEDPAGALAQFLDVQLPPGLHLTVVEETATTLYIVLPANAEAANHRDRPAAEAQIVARALHDAAFRQALLADPAGALQQAFGMHLPSTMTVHVLVETLTTSYLVLPLDPTPALAERELSDLELMTVAGGGRTYRPGDPGSQNGVLTNARTTKKKDLLRRAQRC